MTDPVDPAVLQRRLDRTRKKLAVLETMIEDKTREIYLANEEVRKTSEYRRKLVQTLPQVLLVFDEQGAIREINARGVELFGREDEPILGSNVEALLDRETHGAPPWEGLDDELRTSQTEYSLLSPTGAIAVDIAVTRVEGDETLILCLAKDIRERKRLEVELRHAQKLESVGQLAAGVAHEINTPVQFIGDSVSFLQDAFTDLNELIAGYKEGIESAPPEIGEAVADLEEDLDLAFLQEQIPNAIKRTQDGVQRVAKIVSAMKEFSHPDSSEITPAMLNHALESTVIIAKNEYKYVADIVMEFGDIPEVLCQLNELNQVFLNLLVNGAHAIADVVEGTQERGTLTLRTVAEGDEVVVSIADTGGGIPPEVAERVFEPFFTTKAVGKGTGQGLAIAHNVVKRHGGSLTFETRQGEGTTFFVRLPIGGSAEMAA